ncbi:hypothetical protein Dimus_003901 [Dionaea muscipula]
MLINASKCSWRSLRVKMVLTRLGHRRRRKYPGGKGKKTTTEVAIVEEEEVPSEGTIGEEAENATQESQVMAKKTKPPTKPRKKNIPSPAVGENLVETTGEDAQTMENEEEGDSEATKSDEAVGEYAQAVETFAVPVVNEGDVSNRKAVLDAFGPTVAELDKEEQRETDPSGMLVIPIGSNGGMGKILREIQASKVGAKGVLEEERGGEMVEYEERGYEIEGDGSPSAAGRLKGRKSHETLFTNGRLRSPSTKMINKYMETMMGTTTRATRAAIQNLPLRNELACLSRSMAESSVLVGHAIQRLVKTDERICKKITRLNAEKYVLEQNVEAVVKDSKRMKADVEKLTKENNEL